MKHYRSDSFAKLNEKLCGISLMQLGMVTLDELKIILENAEIKSTDKVLDIGVGMGRVTEYLCTQTNACFIGIDVSDDDLAIAKEVEHDKLLFLKADMTSLPFDENAFDAAVLFDSLNFVKNKSETLDGIAKVIKSGGMLCVCWSQSPFVPMEAYSHEYSEVGVWANKRNLTYTAIDRTIAPTTTKCT
jgi:ubiquinone/menaquinone biosynthesis C-methylase UbiE